MRKICFALMILAALTAMTGCRGNEEATQMSESTQAPPRATAAPQTEATPPAATAPAFQERILVENEDVLVKLTGIAEDPIWGYTLRVYLENRTDDNLMFSVEDAAVNGFMCDPFWASEVRAGMKANQEISFSKSDFEDNGIQQVTDIVFTLHVYDSDDWEKDDYVKQTVTIYP